MCNLDTVRDRLAIGPTNRKAGSSASQPAMPHLDIHKEFIAYISELVIIWDIGPCAFGGARTLTASFWLLP